MLVLTGNRLRYKKQASNQLEHQSLNQSIQHSHHSPPFNDAAPNHPQVQVHVLFSRCIRIPAAPTLNERPAGNPCRPGRQPALPTCTQLARLDIKLIPWPIPRAHVPPPSPCVRLCALPATLGYVPQVPDHCGPLTSDRPSAARHVACSHCQLTLLVPRYMRAGYRSSPPPLIHRQPLQPADPPAKARYANSLWRIAAH